MSNCKSFLSSFEIYLLELKDQGAFLLKYYKQSLFSSGNKAQHQWTPVAEMV